MIETNPSNPYTYTYDVRGPKWRCTIHYNAITIGESGWTTGGKEAAKRLAECDMQERVA